MEIDTNLDDVVGQVDTVLDKLSSMSDEDLANLTIDANTDPAMAGLVALMEAGGETGEAIEQAFESMGYHPEFTPNEATTGGEATTNISVPGISFKVGGTGG